MENGYIKLYRSLTEKGYYRDSEYVHLWVHLLMKAGYRDKEYLFNKGIQVLKPGQFITGRNALAKETGIASSKVQRILKCFENEHQIEQQATNKFRIISICNWGEYQDSEQQIKQQVNSKRTASEQQVNTNNKDKKEKNNIYAPDFLNFYHAYPKRKDRAGAWAAWKKLNGEIPAIGTLLSAIETQKKSEDWLKENGKYIPYPGTWLNHRRWEDEPEVKKSKWD
jgi:DNA-binding transcriptional regulator YhcF (GntR family)